MSLTNPRFAECQRLNEAAENAPAMRRGEGDRAAVVILQRALVDLGYPMPRSTRSDGSMDGIYGRETVDIVERFQVDNGLVNRRGEPDGIVGHDTMHALDRLAPRHPDQAIARHRDRDDPPRVVRRTPRAPPPFIFYRPGDRAPPHRSTPSPPLGGVQRAPAGRDRAGHFTREAMEQHNFEMQIISAARAMGRLHGTLMYLAQNYNPNVCLRPLPGSRRPIHADSCWPGGEIAAERIREFDEMYRAGHIRRRPGSNSYISRVPSQREFLLLERSSRFRTAFNEAVQSQWSFLEEEPYVDALAFIASELASWGAGAVLRRPQSEVALAALGYASRSLRRLFQSVIAKVGRLIEALRARLVRLSRIVRRIIPTGGRSLELGIHIGPVTGRTLPGVGAPHGGGTLPGVGGPQGGGTLPGTGGPQGGGTLPGVGPPPGGAVPNAPGPGSSGGTAGGARIIPLTEQEAHQLHHFTWHGGMFAQEVQPSISITWQRRRLEMYEAKWIGWIRRGAAHGGELPEHGFKVVNPDGTVVDACIHFSEHPWEVLGQPHTW